jgi:hypothetical protein
MLEEVFVEEGIVKEEIKVREYGWQTSYTFKKENKETTCNCFKWCRKGSRWREHGEIYAI